TPRLEAYFVFPLAQGTPGKQCGLAATGVYQPSLRSPWLAAIDRLLYSPMEVAYQLHADGQERQKMEAFFRSMEFQSPVQAGSKVSGFVFTRMDEGYKVVNIDLLGNHDLKSFTLLVKAPGLVTDSSQVDFDHLYERWTDIETEEELRRLLAAMPCCTTDRSGEDFGDPLNIVFIGDRHTLFSALLRAGWKQTETTHAIALRKTIASFLFGSRYLYSPISPLYVFGRPQDIGFQKARESISLRNHMRLWRAPYNFRGKEIYIGQVSRDIGVKFNRHTFTTHVIDPDVGHTRNNLMADLAYSQMLQRLSMVGGSRLSTPEKTYYNLTPDPYYSDGKRAVLFFGSKPTPLDEIGLLKWESSVIDVLGR
ncbi:LssY C-terminal domain-containing protein, partial [Thiolapillus sp.]